jgi:hypothetical protein
MRKLIVIASLLMASCTSIPLNYQGQGVNSINDSQLSTLDRKDYVIGANVETTKTWFKTGPLFFLFGSNGGTEEMRREKAYLQACKQHRIDGIIQPKFETKRLVIPLIVWNFSKHTTYVTGKSYRIKTDK